MIAKCGSLRKLPSGRWQARYTDHNTERMISAPDMFRTKSDASARWPPGARTSTVG